MKPDKENVKKQTENTFELFTAGPNQANWLPTWFRTPIDCPPDFRQFSTHTFTKEHTQVQVEQNGVLRLEMNF